ncbi:family 16 glycosylhydrolase [Bradyrhizobium sp. LHD-71]|uniref:family 16 glycosylhydrolase n=1 Tax=Bradyrhizobium sp. LHD-71 TaxID=3072141 RepID=UPI0028100E14|nr:family 16 glycosylhydrolase [Bradyrhizobium sp. LHD-71]MDQ8727645.1 family 16 glycosylhydrolase [Bradyrhizobium sp. LHD-71]
MSPRFVPFFRVAVLAMLAWASPCHASGWKLVFSDEFDGPTLDRNKWATRYIYNNETQDKFNDERQRYRDRDNHVFNNGVLSLVARKGEGELFESGLIRSHQTFYYGYFEARVFLPAGRGVWPAFWLEADYDIDGRTWHPPEIDIFEYVINGVEDKANMLHSGPIMKLQPTNLFHYMDQSFVPKHQTMFGKEDLNKDWHVAGFVWSPDRVSFFWDGRHIYTRAYQWLRKDRQLGPPAHIDLNFAVGGKRWAGRHGVDEAAFPQEFKIDYVRACQFTAEADGMQRCGGSEFTPDPKEFGYVSSLNDMPKPVFGNARMAQAVNPNPGVWSIHDGEPVNLDVPIKLPDDYPSNRTLEISIYDPVTRAVASSIRRKLEFDGLETQNDGQNVVRVTMPPLKKPGEYDVVAKLSSQLTKENGASEVRPSPVACGTDIVQPVKARSCRLIRLEVKAR